MVVSDWRVTFIIYCQQQPQPELDALNGTQALSGSYSIVIFKITFLIWVNSEWNNPVCLAGVIHALMLCYGSHPYWLQTQLHPMSIFYFPLWRVWKYPCLLTFEWRIVSPKITSSLWENGMTTTVYIWFDNIVGIYTEPLLGIFKVFSDSNISFNPKMKEHPYHLSHRDACTVQIFHIVHHHTWVSRGNEKRVLFTPMYVYLFRKFG